MASSLGILVLSIVTRVSYTAYSKCLFITKSTEQWLVNQCAMLKGSYLLLWLLSTSSVGLSFLVLYDDPITFEKNDSVLLSPALVIRRQVLLWDHWAISEENCYRASSRPVVWTVCTDKQLILLCTKIWKLFSLYHNFAFLIEMTVLASQYSLLKTGYVPVC